MSKKLRVWWVPQVPMKPFYISVDSVRDGAKIMRVLADYDSFQFENRVKPDYCNAGGLEMLDVEDKTDGLDGSWTDWYDDETGEDDPEIFIERAYVDDLQN